VIEEILFYDHPSVENRIRMAMEWKATHPANAPAAAPAVPSAAAATPTP
jgi:STE24 endopeptidase